MVFEVEVVGGGEAAACRSKTELLPCPDLALFSFGSPTPFPTIPFTNPETLPAGGLPNLDCPITPEPFPPPGIFPIPIGKILDGGGSNTAGI